MKASEILKKAREVIINPENWTQEAWARDKEGIPVDERSSYAVCFCSMGALTKAGSIDAGSDEYNYLRAATDYIGIAYFNDSSTHPEVIEAFDKAIALAEKDGK